jgi:hypothetical protein
VTIYRNARQGWREQSLEAVFSDIYRKNSWHDSESVSGRGSTLARTAAIMYHLPLLLRELNAKTLLDAACGDFNWMRHTKLEEVKYVGADVVRDLIARNQHLYTSEGRTFIVLDITKDKIPTADVILCRDCLIHFSFRHIHSTISNFKGSRCTYLLATTHPSVRENIDAPSGNWRSLNLQLPPINFPEPLKLIVEDDELGKCLGVWRLKDL